jgi:hypothetical protein
MNLQIGTWVTPKGSYVAQGMVSKIFADGFIEVKEPDQCGGKLHLGKAKGFRKSTEKEIDRYLCGVVK